ncbi:hypothetical protein Elgi_22670 [Paenibacillus elgii]|nr:hypothetical protein Elgi_22670 [Paenibacillus elgii]
MHQDDVSRSHGVKHPPYDGIHSRLLPIQRIHAPMNRQVPEPSQLSYDTGIQIAVGRPEQNGLHPGYLPDDALRLFHLPVNPPVPMPGIVDMQVSMGTDLIASGADGVGKAGVAGRPWSGKEKGSLSHFLFP